MEKKNIHKRIEKLYNKLDEALSDESIMTIGKVLDKFKEELGDFTQELEDELQEEKDNG